MAIQTIRLLSVSLLVLLVDTSSVVPSTTGNVGEDQTSPSNKFPKTIATTLVPVSFLLQSDYISPNILQAISTRSAVAMESVAMQVVLTFPFLLIQVASTAPSSTLLHQDLSSTLVSMDISAWVATRKRRMEELWHKVIILLSRLSRCVWILAHPITTFTLASSTVASVGVETHLEVAQYQLLNLTAA
jgi:hypothetical protein